METFCVLLAICVGKSPVSDEFPAQRPVTRSFDVFFDLRLNKRLSKQWWGWWIETPSHHYDIIVMSNIQSLTFSVLLQSFVHRFVIARTCHWVTSHPSVMITVSVLQSLCFTQIQLCRKQPHTRISQNAGSRNTSFGFSKYKKIGFGLTQK